MNEYDIVRADASHIMCIHDMAQIAFRHTYKDILSPEQMEYMMDWMYSPDNLKQQMDDGHVYYIAYSGDVPRGYVSVQPEGISADGRKVFHLQKIYILPSEQGHGLGRVLFETAVSHAVADAGGDNVRIELNVNRNNPAVGFYLHLGMTVRRQGDFHIGSGFYMNDYIMGLDL